MERNKEWPKHEAIFRRCLDSAEKSQTLYNKTCWIHLADAVEKGTISPREAYEALDLGYLPEHLKVRESHYHHLL